VAIRPLGRGAGEPDAVVDMPIGAVEIGVLVGAIGLTLWLLPKTLPQLGKAVRQFREEIRPK